MLKAKIEARGKTLGDIELAVEEALKRIMDETTMGFDSNDDGGFSYEVDGEEE